MSLAGTMEGPGTGKSSPKRSLEDVNTVLKYAKLEKTDVRPCVQTIFFSETLENDKYKLLELDSDVLDSLQTGDGVTLRGGKDDHVVLCTKDRTFDLKGAELSNSMLLVKHMDYGPDLPEAGAQLMHERDVICVLHDYFELRPVKPRLKKLKEMLDENHYSGRECEEDDQHQGNKYTMQHFLDAVQASEKEIRTGLRKMKAFELEGRWRMLDHDYLSTVLSHIVQLCEERDWLQEGVPLRDTLDVLHDLFPSEVIVHILRCFSSGEPDEDAEVFDLDEDKVCLFYAEVCLRNAGKFNLSEFLQVWEQSVPEGMKTSLAQVQGVALVDRDSKPETISFFPVEDLPEDVSERFDQLFERRKKWTLDEITPYVADLTTDKMDVGALLTKYSRPSTLNGIKVFSSRRTAS